MDRLRKCREERGLRQKEVAIEVGVKPPTVSQWESGLKTPTNEHIAKLANLYGVSADYLMGRTEEQTNAIGDLSSDELKLLQDYRSLNPQGKEYIRQTMFMALPIYKRDSNLSSLEHKTIG